MSSSQQDAPTQSHLSTHVEVALDSHANDNSKKRFTLLEGCLWHAQSLSILFIDIENPSIHVYKDTEKSHGRYPVEGKIGTVVGTSETNVLMYASQRSADSGVSLLDLSQSKHYSYAHHPEWDKRDRNRFNDGKCSPDGLFYVGTMVLDEVEPRTPDGSLYKLEPDRTAQSDDTAKYYKGYRGQLSKVFDNVTISNGIVWSLRGDKCYYIDTPTESVRVYDYNKQNHRLIVESAKTCIVTKGRGIGFPDGCTIDSEGMLWIAHWKGSRVTRWDPNTGELLHTITLPCSCITSVAFGGEKLSDLYITTANNKVDVNEEPKAGSLFVEIGRAHV